MARRPGGARAALGFAIPEDTMDRTLHGDEGGESGLIKTGLPVPSSSPTSKERQQRFRTPQSIIAALRDVFGEILVDPCASGHPRFWFAKLNITDEFRSERQPFDRIGMVGDGLRQASWVPLDPTEHGCVYFNPEFSDIPPWVEKARTEAMVIDHPIVGCLPNTGAKWIATMMNATPAPTMLDLGKVRFDHADADGATPHTSFYPIMLLVWDRVCARRGLSARDLSRRLGGWVR